MRSETSKLEHLLIKISYIPANVINVPQDMSNIYVVCDIM